MKLQRITPPIALLAAFVVSIVATAHHAVTPAPSASDTIDTITLRVSTDTLRNTIGD